MNSKEKQLQLQDRELLIVGFEQFNNYHDHKELMAYSVFALEGAFFIGLFLLGNWPPTIEAMDKNILAAIFLVTWVLFHSALRFQLRNRRLAAIISAAYFDALKNQKKLLYHEGLQKFEPASAIATFVDIFIVPMRSAFRDCDMELEELDEKTEIMPQTMLSFSFFLINRKREACNSWTMYALPIEWITSVGSIMLLIVALLRVYTI